MPGLPEAPEKVREWAVVSFWFLHLIEGESSLSFQDQSQSEVKIFTLNIFSFKFSFIHFSLCPILLRWSYSDYVSLPSIQRWKSNLWMVFKEERRRLLLYHWSVRTKRVTYFSLYQICSTYDQVNSSFVLILSSFMGFFRLSLHFDKAPQNLSLQFCIYAITKWLLVLFGYNWAIYVRH